MLQPGNEEVDAIRTLNLRVELLDEGVYAVKRQRELLYDWTNT